MARVAYAAVVVMLLGASALAGTGIEDRDGRIGHGAGLVLLTALQRI